MNGGYDNLLPVCVAPGGMTKPAGGGPVGGPVAGFIPWNSVAV